MQPQPTTHTSANHLSMSSLAALPPLLAKARFAPSLSGVYMPKDAIEGVCFVMTPDLDAGTMSITCWLPDGQQTRTFALISAETGNIIECAANYLEDDSREQARALRELRLHILTLASPPPQIIGYRVINDMGEQWGGRHGWEVLSERDAIADLRIARLSSRAFWQIVAILDDEIEGNTLGVAA